MKSRRGFGISTTGRSRTSKVLTKNSWRIPSRRIRLWSALPVRNGSSWRFALFSFCSSFLFLLFVFEPNGKLGFFSFPFGSIFFASLYFSFHHYSEEHSQDWLCHYGFVALSMKVAMWSWRLTRSSSWRYIMWPAL